MPGGTRFCLLHVPEIPGANSGAMLYVHPFAEEMNKSRRMAAVQARALAASGWTVLQMDLFGCGDSEGGFGDASWSCWIDDVIEAAAWLRKRTGFPPALWGLRTGCLLAAQAVSRSDVSSQLIFWQPVLSGRQFLQQFLRLKLTGQLFLDDAQGRVSSDDLRKELAQGGIVEVAGYALAHDMALGLDAAELSPPPLPARVAWFEVASTPALSPAMEISVRKWRQTGSRVDAHTVAGPAFWQTQEISECPRLIDATLAAVENWRPDHD